MDVVIVGLTITDGRGRGDGGGILNAPGGTLSIADSTFVANQARGGPGRAGERGGLYSERGGLRAGTPVGQILPVLGSLQGTFPGLLTVRSRA